MAETIQQDGRMDYFANSFLIEMSRNQIRADKKVLYAKMSTDRDRHFSIATTIEEQNGEKSGCQAADDKRGKNVTCRICRTNRKELRKLEQALA